MAAEKEIITPRHDGDFRKGACHGAAWFLETTRTLSAQGRTADEIADHLADLQRILDDWRSGIVELPDGNPWDWSFKDLAEVIHVRKGDW